MNGIHYIGIIYFSSICCHCIHILGPCIGSHNNNSIRIVGADGIYHLHCIGAYLIPRCIRRFITYFIDDITLILIFFRIHIKEFYGLGFRGIGIFIMNMPVYDSVHTKVGQIRYPLLNMVIQFFLRTFCISTLGNVIHKTYHINAPLIAKILKGRFIEKCFASIPMHSVGTGTT